jgi:hypothetical protein
VAALSSAVKEHGLVLLVLGEWYHQDSLRQMRFFDDNTRSWWTPITGGANVPALNELLAPHNVSLGEAILQGVVTLGDHQVTVSRGWGAVGCAGVVCVLGGGSGAAAWQCVCARTACCRRGVTPINTPRPPTTTTNAPRQISYGANIATFPAGGFLHVSTINDASVKGSAAPGEFAAFGVARSGRGKVAVLGDTNCLDSSHMVRAGARGGGWAAASCGRRSPARCVRPSGLLAAARVWRCVPLVHANSTPHFPPPPPPLLPRHTHTHMHASGVALL